jgi:hypothetical protein
LPCLDVLAGNNINNNGKLSALDGNLDLIAKGNINIGVTNLININFNSQEKINAEISNFKIPNDIPNNNALVAQSPTDDIRDNSKNNNHNLLNLSETNNLSVFEVNVINEDRIIKNELNNNLFKKELLNTSSISIVNTSLPSISTVNQINPICPKPAINNSFTITGKGGLPMSYNEILNNNYGWIDWRIRASIETTKKLDDSIEQSLIEATSWQVDATGIKLVAAYGQESFNDYSLNNVAMNSQMTRYKTEPCNAILRGTSG